MTMKKIKTYQVDEYGIRNYSSYYLAMIALIILYSIIGVFSWLLIHFEQNSTIANITTYGDAFWALMLSASTIGFGDFYPVTLGGRIIVAIIFYIGVGMVGFVGAQLVKKFVGFSDTNVRNRELRKQNEEILKQNKLLGLKIDHLMDDVKKLAEELSGKS